MRWRKAQLRSIAPPSSSKVKLSELPDPVWSLTLDQVEADTGRILAKNHVAKSKLGSSTYVFDEGNVLYSKLRPYLNKVVKPEEKGVATTELVPLRPINTIILSGYLAYYLRSKQFVDFASAMVAGVKMPRVIMEKFWIHEITLPPPSEQRKIVELLDQADTLRKRRAEADKKAERILPALFYNMFGDPATNPMGWEMRPLGDLVSLCRNGTTATQNTDGRGVPVTRIETISDGTINNYRVRYVELDDATLAKWRIRAGDILFSHINSESHIGKCALYNGDPDPLVHGMNLLLLRPRPESVEPEFIFAFLSLDVTRAEMRSRCKRAVNQASLNQRDISTVSVPVPPQTKQRAYAALVDTYETRKLVQIRSAKQLNTLFSTMLHRAFTGELTATWREGHMKELLREMEIQARELGLEAVAP